MGLRELRDGKGQGPGILVVHGVVKGSYNLTTEQQQ